MQPREDHPGGDAAKPARMLCLYDNAGEHFQPGQDTTSSPVTRHLAQSRAILFLFDPTQDLRFRPPAAVATPAGKSHAPRPDEPAGDDPERGRRADPPPCRPAHSAKFERPLIVILSKLDEWSHLLDDDHGRALEDRREPDGRRRRAIERNSSPVARAPEAVALLM